mmetsp:Transcript_4161/g.11938  ORF Transcript_4161/g.11938 Transcript_4161/m.11938 type:complete len:243 (+) Transcript_4161:291-1019(+)
MSFQNCDCVRKSVRGSFKRLLDGLLAFLLCCSVLACVLACLLTCPIPRTPEWSPDGTRTRPIPNRKWRQLRPTSPDRVPVEPAVDCFPFHCRRPHRCSTVLAAAAVADQTVAPAAAAAPAAAPAAATAMVAAMVVAAAAPRGQTARGVPTGRTGAGGRFRKSSVVCRDPRASTAASGAGARSACRRSRCGDPASWGGGAGGPVPCRRRRPPTKSCTGCPQRPPTCKSRTNTRRTAIRTGGTG